MSVVCGTAILSACWRGEHLTCEREHETPLGVAVGCSCRCHADRCVRELVSGECRLHYDHVGPCQDAAGRTTREVAALFGAVL